MSTRVIRYTNKKTGTETCPYCGRRGERREGPNGTLYVHTVTVSNGLQIIRDRCLVSKSTTAGDRPKTDTEQVRDLLLEFCGRRRNSAEGSGRKAETENGRALWAGRAAGYEWAAGAARYMFDAETPGNKYLVAVYEKLEKHVADLAVFLSGEFDVSSVRASAKTHALRDVMQRINRLLPE